MNNFTSENAISWLNNLAEIYKENKDYLTELDRVIGDSDHGINMARGFTAVADKLASLGDTDLGNIFKTTAMTLISTVGGASGPLYGTFFLQMSMKLTGKKEANVAEIAEALEAGLNGVKSRGKAELGEKTMIDAMTPAVIAFSENKEYVLKDATEAAAKASKEGADSTKDLIAKKGRASYLGERSVGHLDPGAVSTSLLFEQLNKVFN